MNILLEQLSKKIGRGHFALHYFPTATVAFFAAGGLSDYDVSFWGGVVLIVTALYALLLMIQRVNDLEFSRWYLLLTLIPLVNLVFFVALLSRKGKIITVSAQTNETYMVAEKRSPVETKNKSGLTTVWAHGETTQTVKKTEPARNHNDVKYCEHCGKGHIKSARFCTSCGQPFPSGI